ncbi:hypothetical protein SV7mr_19710 [Stieleria bergensis]|uniref:NAD(+) hydrolase ThsA n=1 Tax=Stieleria bergensis TaxID=2528025 RepID=A0A517STK7_9BACT|nr:hypothetical protein SV7mr_19710 [Planctomycetes bacterium SV_7m_r]
MTGVDRNLFLRQYSKAIADDTAAVFVGAGLSRPSGYVDWRELLRDIAEDLKLDIDRETDLVAIAQYHLNKVGTRSDLNQLLIDEFTKDATLTENHHLLASLSIDTVWTTNYDDLLERAYTDGGKKIDVNLTKENLAVTVPGRKVTIYKMHGDKTMPEDAVLTKEDYEAYDTKRSLFSTSLRGDLVDKSFLFLGFSFTDPNIDYILSRIRNLLGENQRRHYCIMKSVAKPTGRSKKATESYDYECNKLQHRIADFKRYSIQAVMIDEYSEITGILAELNRRSHLKEVFVSGSAEDFSPFGDVRLPRLSHLLGEKLIREGFNIVSGFGLGIGGSVIQGAMQNLGHNDESRLQLRPFPQKPPSGMSLANYWTAYRHRMISNAGSCVFIAGNKKDSSGNVVEADGVIEEFDICCKQGKFPIPIGATGHSAKRLWERMHASLDSYFPGGGVTGHFDTIGNERKSDEQIVDAVIAILKRISR